LDESFITAKYISVDANLITLPAEWNKVRLFTSWIHHNRFSFEGWF